MDVDLPERSRACHPSNERSSRRNDGVAAPLQRLQSLASAHDALLDWTAVREDIHAAYEQTTGTDQRVALLAMHKAIMDLVELAGGIAPGDMERFREARRQDFRLLVVREALVEPDDNLRTLAITECRRPTFRALSSYKSTMRNALGPQRFRRPMASRSASGKCFEAL